MKIWSDIYDQDNQPTMENVFAFVNSELLNELCSTLENTYNILPRIEYSKCSMQKGWNIKYKKGSKSLCTIYPMDGYFIALVVIGKTEQVEAEIAISTCSMHVQRLFSEVETSYAGKWLMIEVKDREVLEDVLTLINLRVKPKNIII